MLHNIVFTSNMIHGKGYEHFFFIINLIVTADANASDIRCLWVLIAPFGLPVVPAVKTML